MSPESSRSSRHIVPGTVASLMRRFLGRHDVPVAVGETVTLEHVLLDRAADATIVLDRGGVVRYASTAVASVLGHSAADLVGTPLRRVAAPESLAAIMNLLGAATPAQRTRVDCRIRHEDGHWVSLEAVVTDLSSDPQVSGLVVMLHDVSRWQRLEEQLTRQAFHDALTGLPNRALFIDRLEHTLGRRRRPGKTSAVMFLDLDDFKSVNDSLGHVEGDILIGLVAGRLSTAIRPEDTAARLGGDEFALLIEEVDEREAVAIAQRILGAMEAPFELSERSLRVGASVGLALSSARVTTATDMLRAADIAMYTAKEGGKGHFRIFQEEMHDATAQRLRLAVDIRGAVDRGEFVLHYLPTVLLPSGTIVGMEALVRWDHPERGLLAPADFIPLAESTSQIIALGEWVLGQACRQARAWKDARAGQAPLMMNVNLSGVQLQHPGLVGMVTRALEESGLPPEELTLEVPESDMARETDASVHRLRQLKSLGVGIAIDDFGTGLSSLSYLRRFPVDTVKIDRSFVEGIGTGSDELALVRAIVRLARSLRMTTVAEGVEDKVQATRLSSIGCDQAQGYAFGRPMEAGDATTLLLGERTISLWIGHADHELEVVKEVVAGFEAENPGLRVEVVGGMNDDRIVAALAGSQVPNAVASFESDTYGAYVSADGFTDLAPFMARDGIDPAVFTTATQSYTLQDGRRWALPLLADTYGLYYNRALFAEAGLDRPPRTISELTECAGKLTRRFPDGSLAVVGFDPTIGFYENAMDPFRHMFGAAWTDVDGRSMLADDPAWTEMLHWLKSMVDGYGLADLKAFESSVGDEFSPTNAFHSGRLAMMLDGEWRMAFIADEAPELDYGTAPLPVVDGRPELYGSSFVHGTVIGIPQRAAHKEDAWKLIRYLATEDGPLAQLAGGLHNLPSTKSALGSPQLMSDPRFRRFLDMYVHRLSSTAPITAVGTAYQDPVAQLASEWQLGDVEDLPASLREMDVRIDAQLGRARAVHDRAASGRDAGSVSAILAIAGDATPR